jgi:hypothetical protein
MNSSFLYLNTAAHVPRVEFSQYSSKYVSQSHFLHFFHFLWQLPYRTLNCLTTIVYASRTLNRFSYCFSFISVILAHLCIINKPLRRLRCRYSAARIMGYFIRIQFGASMFVSVFLYTVFVLRRNTASLKVWFGLIQSRSASSLFSYCLLRRGACMEVWVTAWSVLVNHDSRVDWSARQSK